jgi:tetratricopeptide (TPR) repeat protein
VYAGTNQYAAAEKEFREALRLDNTYAQPLAYLAYTRGKLKDDGAARELTEELKKRQQDHYVSAVLFAITSLGIGAHDAAMRYLEQAYEDRDDMLSLIKVDPIFAPLRRNPRFLTLLSKVGL